MIGATFVSLIFMLLLISFLAFALPICQAVQRNFVRWIEGYFRFLHNAGEAIARKIDRPQPGKWEVLRAEFELEHRQLRKDLGL